MKKLLHDFIWEVSCDLFYRRMFAFCTAICLHIATFSLGLSFMREYAPVMFAYGIPCGVIWLISLALPNMPLSPDRKRIISFASFREGLILSVQEDPICRLFLVCSTVFFLFHCILFFHTAPVAALIFFGIGLFYGLLWLAAVTS